MVVSANATHQEDLSVFSPYLSEYSGFFPQSKVPGVRLTGDSKSKLHTV